MLLVLTHIVHISLLPSWLGGGVAQPTLSSSLPLTPSLRRSHSTYSFAPSEPTTPYPDDAHESSSISYTSTTHPAPARPRGWRLLSLLSPLPTLVSSLTTVQLKLHTRLVFDHDQVISHEDTWGIKEVFDGLPVWGTIYGLNRKVVAGAGGLACRLFFSRPGGREKRAEEEGKVGELQEDVFGRVREIALPTSMGEEAYESS